MTTTGQPEAPSTYGVHLVNSDQRAAWNRLSYRPTVPTRYPVAEVLIQLGLQDDFWGLCQTGDDDDEQGIEILLSGDWPTNRGYTLEFLSTLRVIKMPFNRRDVVNRIEFRLGNQNWVLTAE